MKRTYRHITYNSDTATEIDRRENMPDQSDLYHYSERLMRTPVGNYFIWMIGGPGSPASHPDPLGGQTGGEIIIPVDDPADWSEHDSQYFVNLWLDKTGGRFV